MNRPCRLILILVVGLAMLPSAYASKQDELENLRRRIALMQSEMDKTSEAKSEVADSLRQSEKAISDSNRNLAQLDSKLIAANSRLHELQGRTRRLSADLVGQQAALGKFLYQQYLGGKHEYLRLLLNNQDPDQIVRNMMYYQYIARSRAAWIASMRDDLAGLDAASKATISQREELASLERDQASQKHALENEKKGRQQTLVRISKQLRQQRREITRLERNENRLAQLVEKISKMLSHPKSQSLFHNDSIPDDKFDGSPFEQLKGKLALPVRGEVTNRFGALRPESTVQWKGLFLKARSGDAVRAIAAGRVVFADWLRGFGNLLIIDHGMGYMSLYADNETLYKQVGDVLRGGDTIATVGNSGGNEDFGLYFELRHESKPLDPMKWLALKSN